MNEIDRLFYSASEFFTAGKLDEAFSCYTKIISKDAQNLRALHALGVVSFQSQNIPSAISYLQKLLGIQPEFQRAWISLAMIQKSLGLLNAARLSYLFAEKINPDSIELLLGLGALYHEINMFQESNLYLMRLLAIDSNNYHAYYELGVCYGKQQKYSEALQYFDKALKLNPAFPEVYVKRSTIFFSCGDIPKANRDLKNAIRIKPDSTIARSLLSFSLHYEPGTAPSAVFAVSCAWAKVAKSKINRKIDSYSNSSEFDRPLRIGFVSPDLRRHPVGFFVQSFMLLYDSEQFKVFCYSDVCCEDEISRTLIDAVEGWRRVKGVSDDKLSELILQDRIDILVDLAGHTKDNRLNVFIIKPAPVQATWAGYVGTTGLDTIDYLISDRFQSPDGAEKNTAEQIVRMPDGYVCFMPPEDAPEVGALPALTNGYITFGCFNNVAKLSESAVLLWSKVLKLLPSSKLFIKNPSFGEQEVVNRYIGLFESQGIAVSRILVEGRSAPDEMLARYSQIDIQLDTIPYSGGLTTLESLWMGVPVITLPGLLFSSRHSFSHLMNAGLPEFVATSEDDYVTIACNLASNIEKLSELRQSLRGKMATSPVCDGFTFTANLQNAFRQMWYRWCQSALIDTRTLNCVTLQDDLVVGDHIACNTQGNFYSEVGLLDLALNCYQQAIDIKPSYIEAYYNAGIVFKKMQRTSEASDMFRLVIGLDPSFIEAYHLLANALLLMGRDQEANHVLFQKTEMQMLDNYNS